MRVELDSGSTGARAVAPAAFRRLGRLVLSAACAFLSLPLALGGNTADASEVQQLMVKLRDSRTVRATAVSADILDALSASAGVSLEHVRRMSGGAQVFRLPGVTTPAEAEAVAQQLRLDPNVELAEPDRRVQPLLVPNDPLYSQQWSLHDAAAEIAGANLPGAWDISTGSAAVIIAVIDTGFVAHADLDLMARVLPGYDFVSDSFVANDGDGRDADPSDPGDWVTDTDVADRHSQCGYSEYSSWHGTHVAGIIGATGQNGIGVTGINWNSKLLPVRVLGKCGGWMSDVLDGARWAAGISDPNLPPNSNPARVINMSLGANYPCSALIQSVVNDIRATGTVVVAAAGNSGADAGAVAPGNCAGVIAVGALDRGGNRAYYSSMGSTVALSAPGIAKSLYNTGTTSPNPSPQGDDYGYMQGTSMAAPHVAGVASLMLSLNPSLTPEQVQQKLRATARAFPDGSTCTMSLCGAGMLDATAALRSAANTTPPVANAGANQYAQPGATVTLSAAASSAAAPASIARYDWTQLSGPSVPLSDSQNANLSFTAPEQSGVLSFQLTVTDDGGLSSSATVKVQLGSGEVAASSASGGSAGGGGCFIATAAYGTASAKEVVQLRAFRDRYLLTNVVGRAFVATYYKLSPPFADAIRPYSTLRALVRAGLTPYVTVARWFGVSNSEVAAD